MKKGGLLIDDDDFWGRGGGGGSVRIRVTGRVNTARLSMTDHAVGLILSGRSGSTLWAVNASGGISRASEQKQGGEHRYGEKT